MAEHATAQHLDRVPSLSSELSSVTSHSDAETEVGERLPNRYVLGSEVDTDDLESIPDVTSGRYPCIFQILDCEDRLDEIVGYKTHVFSHFRGHALPDCAWCFICTQRYHQRAEDDGALAWNLVLDHMIQRHFDGARRIVAIRPPLNLMRWMYSRRLIDDHQLKRAQMCPNPVVLCNPTAANPTLENCLPEAPMAPPGHTQDTSDPLPPSWSTGYHDQPYVIIAGRRAERRQRTTDRPTERRFLQTTM